MLKSALPILLYLFILPFFTNAQEELSYTHYDTKDGLPGSTVYCVTLDKDGFLWFGTENGLSRFDGTHFKNFTSRDGLPDNEILELFTDSKGRVWMAPFRNSVCYYYHGKIYNQDNDSTLAKIKLNVNILHFIEDSMGNILLNEFSGSRMHLIRNDGTVIVLDKINGHPITNSTAICVNANGNFCFIEKDKIYEIKNERIVLSDHIDNFNWLLSYRHVLLSSSFSAARKYFNLDIKNFKSGKNLTVPYPADCLKMSAVNDSVICLGKQSGADLINIKDQSHRNYLPNKPVTSVMFDQEGSLWFTTLGEGIYRLNSEYTKNMSLTGKHNNKLSISCIAQIKDKILLGAELTHVFELSLHDSSLNTLSRHDLSTKESNLKIVNIKQYKDDEIIFFSSSHIVKASTSFVGIYSFEQPVKSLADIGPKKLLIGTSYNAIVFDPVAFKITDTVWNRRATSVFYRNDTFFIGALDGLYLVMKDKSVKYWGSTVPSFKNRIADMKQSTDGTLWIATYGDGVLAYKNNLITAHLTEETGLTSNICRNLFIDSSSLWIGTDKGLNKVNIAKKELPITKYSISDGLASDIINAVFVDHDDVYIGTPKGLTFFNERKLSFNSKCDLHITDVIIAGKHYDVDSSKFSVRHFDNNIRVDFAGISYRSTGDIIYRYRVIGLDSAWQNTRETFLNYPVLPSGDYILQLQAINKFGISSRIISLTFAVEKLLWEKAWFKLLLAAALAGLVWLLLSFRVRTIRKQEKEKLRIINRIAELEQLALKSQMNPHFIFNSLNSIQQYVMDKDIAGANKFISGFSRLMRQTLHFSSKQYISLSDELDYLTTYLELEKNRLEDVFIYKITISSNIYPPDYLISPMILQPFVENSVRHGVRYRKDKSGIILINVTRLDKYLICEIEDNGIGRKASQQFKGHTAIEYQSKGMSLTNNRIAMLNQNSLFKMDMHIDDLEDDEKHATGTRVTVRFPIIEN